MTILVKSGLLFVGDCKTSAWATRVHIHSLGHNYLTPFSDDAQKRIRDKRPLELAGYEVHKLPMAHLLRGLALQWPASAFQEIVPNA